MTNKEKYINAFVEGLAVEKKKITEELKYGDIMEWDSIGQLGLISKLEEIFDITMNAEDIMEFDSFKKGIEILAGYGINI